MLPCLCFNVGSSSLAFSLFEEGEITLSGGIDLNAEETVRYGAPNEEPEQLDVSDPGDFPTVTRRVLDSVSPAIPVHRVVHGGETSTAAAWLDKAELARLEALAPLAPLHQEANLAPARAISEARPFLRQIVVYDTAFHHGLPQVARRLPIPEEGPLAGLRRYGFHGLSHGWVARRMAVESPDCRRVVSLHLSGGASACAIRDGRSTDTTMGATPVHGLMMGTRSGTLDPGVLLYALEQGMSRDELAETLWRRSGLRGVSGVSADLRDIMPKDTSEARLAVQLFCRSAAKAVAAMTVSLGGLDALVFTGGAGAEQPPIRQRILDDLRWLGVALDPEANERDAATISAPESSVLLRVIPAEEERMMADAARSLLEEDTS